MIKQTHHDRVLPETRWLAAFVLPFLVVAFVMLYGFPAQTGRLFAWNLQPSMSAMMLGAAYAGGIYFFTSVLLIRQWHRIAVGFLPVLSFAAMLGVATLIHWDRFNHNHVSFVAWAGVYALAPFLVVAVWLRNRGQDAMQPEQQDVAIPFPVRLGSGVIGGITVCISIVLFLNPQTLIAWWPWTLSPLSARVMGAMFALPGIVGLGIARDTRWSAASLILQAQAMSILFILGAALRARADFDWNNPGSWLFVGGLGVMLAGIIILFLAMHARQRRLNP